MKAGWNIKLMVYDLVTVGGKLIQIGLDDQGLIVIGEGLLGFDDDKVIDVGVCGVESNFQPIQFGVDHNQIVDFSLIGLSEGNPPVLLT